MQTIGADLDVEPDGLAALAGAAPGAALPALADVQRKLDSLRQERERLGAVNLRADEELAEVEGARDKLIAERDDLTEAIRKLRGAIGSLNQEGRERLLAAFDVVNGHFQSLFSTLFEGGEAELQLVESDDPLQAGLELIAKPPGKKPQTLTLLSGGEQALTAMSLIFAVFLTNPSPICVLDEVDAPLDDYNVERFCDLLEEMRKRSDTRFVTITHNPITMARMDRLFGVTMAERGRQPDRVGGAGGSRADAGGGVGVPFQAELGVAVIARSPKGDVAIQGPPRDHKAKRKPCGVTAKRRRGFLKVAAIEGWWPSPPGSLRRSAPRDDG